MSEVGDFQRIKKHPSLSSKRVSLCVENRPLLTHVLMRSRQIRLSNKTSRLVSMIKKRIIKLELAFLSVSKISDFLRLPLNKRVESVCSESFSSEISLRVYTSGSQPFMVRGPFPETLNTVAPLLKILSQKTSED